MVDICPSAKGRGIGGSEEGGESSRARARNSRQHAVAVEHVTRPMCPRTVWSCFLVQLAISGRSAIMAA